MDYIFLKQLGEHTFDNFESLFNNIKNKDKNIYNTFRVIIEDLFEIINKRENILSNIKYGFINAALNNNDFLYCLMNNYNCNTKIMSALNSIHEYGNKSIHNNFKLFDPNDVKEKYIRVLFLARNIHAKHNHIEIRMERKTLENDFNKLIDNEQVEQSSEHINDTRLFYDKLFDFELQFNNLFTSKDIYIYNKEQINEIFDVLLSMIDLILDDFVSKNKLISYEDLRLSIHSDECELVKYHDKFTNFDINLIDNLGDIKFIIDDVIYLLINVLKDNYKVDIFKDYFINDTLSVQEQGNIKDDDVSLALAIDEVHNEGYVENTVKDIVFYIEKQKPFVVNNCIYYELEVRKAIDFGYKSNKQTIYSKDRIRSDYAMKLSMVSKNVKFYNLDLEKEIFIVTASNLWIRPCELNNIIELINGEKAKFVRNDFYKSLMSYFEIHHCSILDIVITSDKLYNDFKEEFKRFNSKDKELLFKALDKAREVIINELDGSNIIRYLLGTMNNRIIKEQKQNGPNKNISQMLIKNGALKFDRAPYSFSLCKHNPSIADLYKCIQTQNYQIDLLAKRIKDYMIEKQITFVPINEFSIDNAEKFILMYNSNMKYPEDEFAIYEISGEKYIYLKKYKNCLQDILEHIDFNTSIEANDFYQKNKDDIIQKIDASDKLEIFNKCFKDSKMLLLYGEAGSGKTEFLCNYIASVFKNCDVRFVANTHVAVQNMKDRVKKSFGFDNDDYFKYQTIRSLCAEIRSNYYVNKASKARTFAIIIDECNSISNDDINCILNNLDYEYCILSGDIYQIKAINFGNWFKIAKNSIFSNSSAFELTNNFRTVDKHLMTIWNKVRNYDETVLNDFINNKMIKKLDSEVFIPKSNDEIILCLNYRGRYGINNINTYFQESKKEKEFFRIATDRYKIGDPIVFNNDSTDLDIYKGVLYNNLKGKIKDINKVFDKDNNVKSLIFILEVYTYIKSIPIDGYIKLISSSKSENISLISLKIEIYKDNAEDNKDKYYTVPFDVAYARSIHKSQGLEYDSVKLIITPESEEVIDNSIFYTAITRAKKYLSIYCVTNSQLEDMGLLYPTMENVDCQVMNNFINK